MGFFSRISRESGTTPATPEKTTPEPQAAEPRRQPEPAPAGGGSAPEQGREAAPAKKESDMQPNENLKSEAAEPIKAEAEPTPAEPVAEAASSAAGPTAGAKQPEPATEVKQPEPAAEVAQPEPPAEVKQPEPAAEAAPADDLIPPDAAPVPRRVTSSDAEADEPVRLRAEDIIAPTPRRPHPFAPAGEDADEERRAKVISFANQKGGVAKTTTTLNLGVALAEQGFQVLLIDLDPQGNLTMSQGIDPELVEKSMYDVLVEHIPIRDVIVRREVDLAVASIDLAGAEIAMSTQIGRERSLQKALREIGNDYDYVCIDTPPSLGLLTINALTASNKVIVPVQCEYLSMRGLAQLQNTLEMIRENLNPGVEIEGILPTMMDARTVHAKEAVEILEESFGDLVFKTKIKKAVKFAEAPVRGASVLKYDPESKAAEYYRRLAQEVLSGVKA